MPVWTAFGVKSRISVAGRRSAEARVVEVLEPQAESVVTRRQAISAASGLAAGISPGQDRWARGAP